MATYAKLWAKGGFNTIPAGRNVFVVMSVYDFIYLTDNAKPVR